MLMRHIIKSLKYNLDMKLQTQWTCYGGNETYMRRELMTWKMEIIKVLKMYSERQKKKKKGKHGRGEMGHEMRLRESHSYVLLSGAWGKR